MRKGLKVVSMLMLILGIVTVAVGVLSAGLLSNSGDGGTEVKALIGLTVILAVVGGVLDIIGGWLGLRAAKRSYKATGAIVFGFLALAAGIASVVLEVNVQNICACVIPLVYFVCAVGVKTKRV